MNDWKRQSGSQYCRQPAELPAGLNQTPTDSQYPSIPPPPHSHIHKDYTLHTTSTTSASSELSKKRNVQTTLCSFSWCDCFSSLRTRSLPQRGGGGTEGGMKRGNTHLFLRGSGKSFWKKDKEREKKREIRHINKKKSNTHFT